MKIGINTLFYLPGDVGGSETYLLEILRAWKRASIPHEVVLFTQRENHERLSTEFAGEGWTCVLSPFRAANRVVRILREQVELPIRVRRARADVLWSPGYTAPVFAGCPQVVTLLDMQYKHFPQDLSWLARLTTNILVQACAVDRRKQILTISEYAKSDITLYTPARADRIKVTPLAANPDFQPLPHADPARTPYLLCVANSYPHKAVDKLVRAYARVEDHIPHNLVLVGKPRLGEPAVQTALQTLKNPERVKRPSGLSRNELIALYQGADLFVFPSEYEGFGLPVLEAMQAGVPVLTTRCASIPEVGGDAVEYVDEPDPESLADRILHLLTETPEQRKQRIHKARMQAATFSWERCAADTLKVLMETGSREYCSPTD